MSAKAARETVTEKELGEIKRDRTKLKEIEASAYEANIDLNKTPAATRLATLNKEAGELRLSLATREEGIVDRLRRGVKVIGKFVAMFQIIEGACRPKWKEAFMALAERMKLNPQSEEKRVKDATEVPKEYRLVIE